MKKFLFVWIALLIGLSALYATRTTVPLEQGWKFTRNDDPKASDVVYDDSNWQTVRVPHDWAIYGPFSKENDIHRMAIVQDGQTTAIEHYGRTGGLPFTGVGWYRNTFSIPGHSEGRRVIIQFDGAMSNARVFVNGKEAGYWPNGYNTFYFDITGLVHNDGQDNLLAVRLENFEEQSRWYPGAGLYRNVHIITTNEAYIPVWGTYVTTPEVNQKFARVNVKTKVVTSGEGNYRLVTEINDASSRVVASDEALLTPYDLGEISRDLFVEDPLLWDIRQPNMYRVVSKL